MRNMRLRVARKRVQMLSSDTASRRADDVKTIVRDALSLMTGAEQVEFIQALESEMRRENLSIAAYLIPLGSPGMPSRWSTLPSWLSHGSGSKRNKHLPHRLIAQLTLVDHACSPRVLFRLQLPANFFSSAWHTYTAADRYPPVFRG